MTVVKPNKRAKPDPELLKLADSLLANYQKPDDLMAKMVCSSNSPRCWWNAPSRLRPR